MTSYQISIKDMSLIQSNLNLILFFFFYIVNEASFNNNKDRCIYVVSLKSYHGTLIGKNPIKKKEYHRIPWTKPK